MRRRTPGSIDFPPKPVTEGEQEVRDLFHKMTALTIFGEREGDQSATELFSKFAEPRLAGIYQMERDLLTTPVSDQNQATELSEKIARYRDELTTLKSLDLDQSTSEARKNAILKILADEKEIRSLIDKEKGEDGVLELQATDRIVETVNQADVTPAEQKKLLSESVEAVRVAMESKDYSKAAVEERKQHYFDELKKYQKERGALGLVGEKFTKEKLPKELKELRDQWYFWRANYARSLRESAETRLDNRLHGESNLEREKVLERYNRLITVREVAFGGEEEELAAKKEGLSMRDQGSFEKLLERYQKLPPGVRILGTSALLFGAGAVATGGAIGLVPLALGGSSAVMRWAAEAQKSPNGKKILSGLSRLTSIGGIGGLLSELGIKKAHEFLGTTEKAKEALRERDEKGNNRGDFGDLSDRKVLEKLIAGRRSALTTEEDIARQARIARVIGSVGTGALLGGVAHDYLSGTGTHAPGSIEASPVAVVGASDISSGEVHASASTIDFKEPSIESIQKANFSDIEVPKDSPLMHEGSQEVTSLGVQHAEASAQAEISDSPASVGPTVNTTTPLEAGAATVPETISTPVTAEIHEGEGALKMFSDLKSNLRAKYPEGSDMPENVKLILDRDPQVLAKTLGFMHADGSSRIMHVGDSIKVDSHGAVVFADYNPKIEPVSLINHVGKLETTEVGGRFETQPIPAVAETTSTTTPEPVVTAPTPAPVSVPPPAAAPVEANSGAMTTAQLNAEQLAKITNEQAPVTATIPEHMPESVAPQQTIEPSISNFKPWTNDAGVKIVEESQVYEHSSHRSVIWSGNTDFQKDLDLAKTHLEKLVAEGKHGSVLVERERINTFTNKPETIMLEFSTDTDDVAVYESGNLPIKPYGPNDFVNPKK